MLIEKTAWPQNKTCAAMISVNLDAEFFWKRSTIRTSTWTRATFCAWGAPASAMGLPKLLEVLDRYEVKATVFYTGSRCEALSGGGCLHRFAWA